GGRHYLVADARPGGVARSKLAGLRSSRASHRGGQCSIGGRFSRWPISGVYDTHWQSRDVTPSQSRQQNRIAVSTFCGSFAWSHIFPGQPLSLLCLKRPARMGTAVQRRYLFHYSEIPIGG